MAQSKQPRRKGVKKPVRRRKLNRAIDLTNCQWAPQRKVPDPSLEGIMEMVRKAANLLREAQRKARVDATY